MTTKINMQPLSSDVARNYDSGCYGPSHMRTYRSFRDDTLARIIAERFGTERRLKILDVGCGTGLMLEYLSMLPARHELSGMDFSEPMLKEAVEKAAHMANPPELVQGSVYEIPFADGTFDVVYASRFIHQFSHEDKQLVYKELHRVTREGGVAAVEFYARPHYSFQWYAMPWRRKKDKETYFKHFPSWREVQEIVGRPFEVIPVRLIGSRVWYALLRDAGLRKLDRKSVV